MDVISDPQFSRKTSLDENILEAIVNSKSGLFRYLKTSKGQVRVRNLMSRSRISVFDENVPLLLDRDDYFQTRVFTYQGEFYFGASLVIHPPLARRFLDKKIREIQNTKDKECKQLMTQNFFNEIFKMYYRALRFKQIEIDKIYSETPVFFEHKRNHATL